MDLDIDQGPCSEGPDLALTEAEEKVPAMRKKSSVVFRIREVVSLGRQDTIKSQDGD
jgi:hypothetical protein